MAPICSQKSLSTKISNSSSQMNCGHSKQSADSLWGFSLPISRRGLFFQDSFFDHAQSLFNDAVQEALGRWGETSILTDRLDDTNFRLSNNLSRYRQLRAHNLKEEVLAVTASTDNTCHKIVVDVHDFMDGVVKVKVAGEREVVVEGLTNNMDSSALSHSFTHHFALPHLTNIKAITAVMSSDGILTITAPKTTNGPNKEGSTIPIRVEGTDNTEQSSSLAASHNSTSSSNTKLPQRPEDECECRGCRQDQEELRSHTKQQRVHQIPIRINSTLVKNKCDLQTSDIKTSFDNNIQSEIKSKEESKRNSSIATKQNERQEDTSRIEKAENVSSNTSATPNNQHTIENHARTASEIQVKKSSSNAKEVRNIPLSQSSFLPITRRGLFFNDSFFEDTQKDFQNAVNEILKRWDREELTTDSSLRPGNNLSRYRQLRAHNLREENQAVTITTSDTCHKIVMDVHDFLEGEVKVKVGGQREVMVEGHTNTNTSTGGVSVTSQSFRRQFSLPDQTNIEAITAVMSSDGILTITVPKSQVDQIKDNGMIIPITIEGNPNSEAHVKTSATSVSKATISNSASDTNSKLLKLKEGNCKSEKCRKKECMQNNTESTLRQNEEKNFARMQKAFANSTNNSNSSCKQQIDTVTGLVGTFGTRNETSGQKLSSVSSKNEQLSHSQHSEVRQSSSEPGNIHLPNFTTLPIMTRGLFFDDSFFKNAWKDFQDAVREVVSKWGQESSTSDYLTCYRNLRTRDLRDENQAVKSSEDEFNYKFVVDVQDFTNGGEITVKAVNERELVVEGHVEKKEGGSRFTKKFLRRFVVPGAIHLESVTSVMSSDGVLTINVPKKPETLKIKEVIVPMSVEEGINEAKSFNQSSSHILRAGVETPAREPSTAVTIDTEEYCDSPTIDVSSSLFSATESTRQDGSSTDISSLPLDTVVCSNEHIIPVQLEEELQTLSCDTKSLTTKNKMSHRDQLTNDTSIGNEVATSEKFSSKQAGKKERTSDIKSEAASNIQKVSMDGQAVNLSCRSKSNVFKDNEGDKTKLDVARYSQSQRENINCVSVNRFLPISMKGSFFSDTFFEDARENFAAAVKDVLRRTNEVTYLCDDISSYRNLRLRDLRSENQAFHVEEDQHSLKIVVDVFDFIGGDVKVEVVGGKEVVVEGEAKRQEGTSAATQTFLLRFSLPHNVDLQGISSAMSSDGVLTVISPKIQKTVGTGASNKERSIESHSRMESHSDTGRSLQEKNMRQSTKESEGSSSRSFSSSHRSQHQYSSNKQI